MISYEEEKVGKKAAEMLKNSLHTQIGQKFGFYEHYHGKRKKDRQPLKKTTSVERLNIWTGNQGDRITFLNAIVISMGRQGYIQHYGVNRIRKGGKRTRKTPKHTTYNFEAHYFRMKATPFIDEAVAQSGAVPYILREISRIRGTRLLKLTGRFLADYDFALDMK